MYYYYARTSVSTKRVWWKKHLTTMQITQFVIDLFAINFGFYTRVAYDYPEGIWGFKPWQPTWGIFGSGTKGQSFANQPASCAGTYPAAFTGVALICSYLLLFIQFFFETYKKPATSQQQKRPKRD